jgi:hypothetical protein
MGYRQDFKFIIVGTEENLQKVMAFIEEMATSPSTEADLVKQYPEDDHYGTPKWAAYLLEIAKWFKHEDPQYADRHAILFEDMDLKAYGMFDTVVDRIIEQSRDFGCQSQYAHVGDELDDMRVKGYSDDIFLSITRSIDEPEW